MTNDDTQFLEFITGTLLPDMEQEGPSGTADDIKRLVRIIHKLSIDDQAYPALRSFLAGLRFSAFDGAGDDDAILPVMVEAKKFIDSAKTRYDKHFFAAEEVVFVNDSILSDAKKYQAMKDSATGGSPDPLGASQPCPEA